MHTAFAGPRRRTALVAGLLSAATLALTACGGGSSSDDASAKASAAAGCKKVDEVRLVLQWVAQSQFAGYYQAKDKGLYAKACLDVKIQEGGPNVVAQQVLASGNAEFAVSHVTKSLATREQGADLVNVSQIFQRGAYLQVSWKDSNINSLQDLKGTRVGSWGFGNELVLFAGMRASGVDPEKDVKVVQQPFDMSLLLKREVDSAQAKTYNEYAQLLEAKNPKTGELYQPGDFSVLNLQELGHTSYEDGIWAQPAWLKKPGNEDIAERFIKATMEGWISCRDDFDPCVDTVLKNGATLGRGHMAWQLNEVNKLIWPSPKGIGVVNPKTWDATVAVAREGGVLKRDPAPDAYRTDLNAKALKALEAEKVDVTGKGYEPRQVEITLGGK